MGSEATTGAGSTTAVWSFSTRPGSRQIEVGASPRGAWGGRTAFPCLRHGSIISHNFDGGILNTGPMKLINSTVSRNRDYGILTGHDGYSDLNHVTVAENGHPGHPDFEMRAGLVGGAGAQVVLTNTIVANNLGTQCHLPPGAEAIVSAVGSLIGAIRAPATSSRGWEPDRRGSQVDAAPGWHTGVDPGPRPSARQPGHRCRVARMVCDRRSARRAAPRRRRQGRLRELRHRRLRIHPAEAEPVAESGAVGARDGAVVEAVPKVQAPAERGQRVEGGRRCRVPRPARPGLECRWTTAMISVTAQHALRARIELASLPPAESVGGRELAHTANIPPNYLAKILRALGVAGLIAAARGTGGGYRLSRAPRDIRLVDVVMLFDPARSASECLMDGTHPCSDATACAAHREWRHVRAKYVRFLERTTLATLAARHALVRHPKSAGAPRATSRHRTS